MDRELRVTKNGQVLAELRFDYTGKNNGKVYVIINRIIDLGDDMYSSYPLWEADEYFSHGELKTLAECKAFDQKFLLGKSDFSEHSQAELQFHYEPIVFRYNLVHRNFVGIAEFNADYDANTKQLKFLSARRQKEDWQTETTVLENNREILKKFCEDYLDCYGVDIKPVGWN